MKQNELDGFTIIETALAVAIGGLIFSMIFLVLPSALANARDGERRDDMLLVTNKLKNFQANNNRGALPSDTIASGGLYINGSGITFGPTSGVTWADFYRSFFDDGFGDPKGNRYNWQIVKCGANGIGKTCTDSKLASFMNKTFDENNFTIYFVIGATCDGDTAVSSANSRLVSVLYKLERAGTYCVNT